MSAPWRRLVCMSCRCGVRHVEHRNVREGRKTKAKHTSCEKNAVLRELGHASGMSVLIDVKLNTAHTPRDSEGLTRRRRRAIVTYSRLSSRGSLCIEYISRNHEPTYTTHLLTRRAEGRDGSKGPPDKFLQAHWTPDHRRQGVQEATRPSPWTRIEGCCQGP